MIPYENIKEKIASKYNKLVRTSDWPVSYVLKSNIDPYYSIIEYEIVKSLIPHIDSGAKIAILGSWFGITFLETFSLIKDKIDIIKLFDYDQTVKNVGDKISNMIDIDIRYLKKNVIFDDISKDIDGFNIFIIPYIHMLLPIDELIPNLVKGNLISISGSNDAFLMRYGNPIFNVDDLRQQTTFNEELYSLEKQMKFRDSRLLFKKSILTARI